MALHLRLASCALAFSLASAVAAAQTPSTPAGADRQTPDDPHAGHVMEPAAERPPAADLPPFIPRPTDEDRRAAFPDVGGHHAAHDRAVHAFVLLDRIEWQRNGPVNRADADVTGWVGRDLDRLWFRVDGHGGAQIESATGQLFYGRRLFRWWDAVAGVRQDAGVGPARTWAAVGLQGLAPYWFEVEATLYVGSGGRTQARLEAEYDLRITNRLIVQPLASLQIGSTADPERRLGAGLSATETGVRVRYLVRREFAPYVGVTWNHAYGDTARLTRAAGEPTSAARFVTGVRAWF